MSGEGGGEKREGREGKGEGEGERGMETYPTSKLLSGI